MPSTDPILSNQALVLKYRVRRSEIWGWYWWAWRQPRGLWFYWVVVGAAIAAGTYLFRIAEHQGTSNDVVVSLVLAVAICGLFILYPQFMYKERERVLRLDATGIETSIGKISAHRSWKDIASIVDRGTYIAIVVAGGIQIGPFWLRTLNGNAFVVPNRAFESVPERLAFLKCASEWHVANALRFPRFSRSRYYG